MSARRLLEVVALVGTLAGCAGSTRLQAASPGARPTETPPAMGATERGPDPSLAEPEVYAESPDSIARMVGYWPNTVLVTHLNEEVRFYDDLVRGKCVLINFMYLTCDGI